MPHSFRQVHVTALILYVPRTVQRHTKALRNDRLSYLERKISMNEPSDSSSLNNPGKMAQVDKVERIIRDRNLMTAKVDAPFFTTFACRLFKSNFYYMSLKLLHCGSDPGLVKVLRNAQTEFANGLGLLRKEPTMEAYSAWKASGNTLHEIRLVDVKYIAPECRGLATTFRTLDEFLIPVYVAQTHQMISGVESKMITDKVKILYDTMLRRFSEQVSGASDVEVEKRT